MITNIDELAKFSREKIEIIKELHRNKAVEVLRNHNKEVNYLDILMVIILLMKRKKLYLN